MEGHWLISQHQIVMSIPTIVPMEGHWLTSQHQIVMGILTIVPMEGHWLTSQHPIVMSILTIVPMEGHQRFCSIVSSTFDVLITENVMRARRGRRRRDRMDGGGPGENHQPLADKLYHIMLYISP
jgi:hypothetical protein